MDLIFESGVTSDIDELEVLYNNLNDYLSMHTNYPGWIKGVYPTRKNATEGISNQNLFVVRSEGKIAGSIILNHQPEDAYNDVNWLVDAKYENIYVLRTFVIHPDFIGKGIGNELLNYSIGLAKNSGIKSIRLDVYEKNIPAIRLYEKNGFVFTGTVDLGLENYGLEWFRLYEKII
ncbi:acetyltransferase [Macellibacteroides sp. HH-ZS]|nr:acetyltransferase [Macellibacteroides sp. HH-ZS]